MSSVDFTDNSAEAIAALEHFAEKFLTEAATVVESQVEQNTVADSHHTKESWDYIVDTSKYEAVVGNPLENAIWEEFGTGDYAIEGGRKGSPWYVPVDGYTGRKKPTYNGNVVVVHGKNNKDYFKTNGKKPKRCLQKAYEVKKSSIIRRAQQLAREEFG